MLFCYRHGSHRPSGGCGCGVHGKTFAGRHLLFIRLLLFVIFTIHVYTNYYLSIIPLYNVIYNYIVFTVMDMLTDFFKVNVVHYR